MIEPQEFKRLLDFIYSAHQEHLTKNAFRQDGRVPFVVHPLWCAMMLVNDTRIPDEERQQGFQALLLHDILEDTSLPIPDFVEPAVVELVQAMTHTSWEEEKDIEGKSPLVLLLKLCDKMASMYDETVRQSVIGRRREWKELTQRLLNEAEKNYKESRITQIARAILDNTDWR